MTDVEVFLDEMPGETRGMIARNGRFETLLIHREVDSAVQRLGARSVGRVTSVDRSLGGAFVELDGATGFLPTRKSDVLRVGQAVEVTVTAEPRGAKACTLRLIGEGQGAPCLLSPGPSVPEILSRLAPDVNVQTGVAAIQASWEAEEDALSSGAAVTEAGLDLAVQRTRALIAVDIDWRGVPGQDGRKARATVNRLGLMHAARLIRLKSWGGLVAIDLVGANHDAGVVMAASRQAFGDDPQIGWGPLNRFGVLQLSLPWRHRPIEDRFFDDRGGRAPVARAIEIVRRTRHAMLTNTRAAWVQAKCAPEEAALAAPWIARLGPRARIEGVEGMTPGRAVIEEH